MSEHTPGPWEASNTGGPWSSGGDGGTVEAISPDGAFVTREICHFLIDPDDEGTLGEDLANARLIAAAPDLLEALRPFAAYREGFDMEDVRRARDAIRKATGEDQSWAKSPRSPSPTPRPIGG